MKYLLKGIAIFIFLSLIVQAQTYHLETTPLSKAQFETRYSQLADGEYKGFSLSANIPVFENLNLDINLPVARWRNHETEAVNSAFVYPAGDFLYVGLQTRPQNTRGSYTFHSLGITVPDFEINMLKNGDYENYFASYLFSHRFNYSSGLMLGYDVGLDAGYVRKAGDDNADFGIAYVAKGFVGYRTGDFLLRNEYVLGNGIGDQRYNDKKVGFGIDYIKDDFTFGLNFDYPLVVTDLLWLLL